MSKDDHDTLITDLSHQLEDTKAIIKSLEKSTADEVEKCKSLENDRDKVLAELSNAKANVDELEEKLKILESENEALVSRLFEQTQVIHTS